MTVNFIFFSLTHFEQQGFFTVTEKDERAEKK